ncbi:MAG: penicillin-binding transpeptidase domain-containing protein [Pseudomonadota bacterium]|jgi:cell division protein FtsI (penicillin-binding protein 3)|nr:penicillin-binding transpeptidase domain-containing protein [Pseudomonadota bacterium]
MSKSEDPIIQTHAARSWRIWLVVLLLALIVAAITSKLLSLYGDSRAFLRKEGEARTVRTVLIPAHRGLITDRNGEPLAVSAPVATIWADPPETDLQHAGLSRLARLLGMQPERLRALLNANADRHFLYLKRQVTPELAAAVEALRIPGVHADREYKRYYPAGEVATHLIGFTNVDGEGQEGLELAYNHSLRGEPGRKLVLKDRLGRTIKHIRSLEDADAGNDLQLSIDMRLQYMAYRELKAAVETHRADSGAAVVLDVNTGEVLALVNQPSYNPNDRSTLNADALRNRAMTDLFEPGSTIKPLTVAAAIMSGQFSAESVIDTSPGYIRVGGATINDHRNYGKLNLTRIITKSSNVGVTRLALALPHDAIRNLLHNVGFGRVTGTGFPGERGGVLPYLSERQRVERATLSYGYGLSTTLLQLAQAYLPLAADGILRPVSLLKRTQIPAGTRVLPPGVGPQLLAMLETVISPEGTGSRAAVEGYRVGGKTGTVHKASGGGYAEDRYVAVFAGIAPLTNPRLVIAVMVDNPKGQEYFGGLVAAPVFSRIAAGALRLLNVPPDDWPEPPSTQVALQ